MRRHPPGLWLAVAALAALPASGAAQSWRNVSMSRQISGEDHVRVQVTYGAGTFKLNTAEDPDILYRMQLRYDEDVFEPHADYENGRLHLGVEGLGKSIHIGKKSGGELDLALTRSVPMDLRLEFGAVRANLNLGGMSLSRLELSTGASESDVDVSEPNPVEMRTATFEVGAADFEARHLGNLNARHIDVSAGIGGVTLWFNGQWQQNASVSINMGLGSLELRVPEGLGVKLSKDSFLTALDSEGLVKRGDSYYSLDWDTADRKIDIDLDAAFGSVKVVWVR